MECSSISRMPTPKLNVTPGKYFKPSISLNEDNVRTFRHLYRTLSTIDHFDGHDIDENALLNAAQQLGIQADLNDYQEILRECVKYEDDEQTFLCVDIRIQGSVQQLLVDPPPTPSLTSERLIEDKAPRILTDIKCVLVIKHRGKDVNDFLRTFLLHIVKETSTHK